MQSSSRLSTSAPPPCGSFERSRPAFKQFPRQRTKRTASAYPKYPNHVTEIGEDSYQDTHIS